MSSSQLTAVCSQPGASGGRTWDGQPGGATKGILRVYRTLFERQPKPLLELGEVRVAHPCGVVLPPHVAVDQPSGHPFLVGVEEHHLERRAGRPVAGRQEAVRAAGDEAPGAVVRRTALEEQGWCVQRTRGLERRRHQGGADLAVLTPGHHAQRAQNQDVDQLPAGVHPGVADADVADDLAVLDRDQAGSRVPGGHHVVPEGGHLVAVVSAAFAERGRHHPPYVGSVDGKGVADLHGATLTETAATDQRVSQLSWDSNCSTPPSQEANGSGEDPPSPYRAMNSTSRGSSAPVRASWVSQTVTTTGARWSAYGERTPFGGRAAANVCTSSAETESS